MAHRFQKDMVGLAIWKHYKKHTAIIIAEVESALMLWIDAYL